MEKGKRPIFLLVRDPLKGESWAAVLVRLGIAGVRVVRSEDLFLANFYRERRKAPNIINRALFVVNFDLFRPEKKDSRSTELIATLTQYGVPERSIRSIYLCESAGETCNSDTDTLYRLFLSAVRQLQEEA